MGCMEVRYSLLYYVLLLVLISNSSTYFYQTSRVRFKSRLKIGGLNLNFDEFMVIRQICQCFLPPKFPSISYLILLSCSLQQWSGGIESYFWRQFWNRQISGKVCVLARHEWSSRVTCEEMLSVQHICQSQSEVATVSAQGSSAPF